MATLIGRYAVAGLPDALASIPCRFPLKAHDVPAAFNVARELLPDDEEAAEQYNFAQEAFAISAREIHIRTGWRLLRKND
jgi:hypothetical protein